MIKALEISLEKDLSDYAAMLRLQRVPHRIAEEGPNQVVWVENETHASIVRLLYEQFEAGVIEALPERPSTTGFDFANRLWKATWRFPATIALILVTILLFPVGLQFEGLQKVFLQMIFTPATQYSGEWYVLTLGDTMERGEYWRLLTPMFIHFGWLHIVFNLLWIWEIGRRIEIIHGPWVFLGLVTFSSFVSNLLQYALTGPGLFGGMSGVVFGLLGYALVWSKLRPARSMGVPNGVYIFMLIYLSIGFTGAVDLLGLGSIANGAHLGGLIAGLITGGLAVLLVPPPKTHER